MSCGKSRDIAQGIGSFAQAELALQSPTLAELLGNLRYEGIAALVFDAAGSRRAGRPL